MLPKEKVQEVVNSSPMTAKQALEHKILDNLAYRDSAHVGMKEGHLPRVSMKQYLQNVEKEKKRQRQARCLRISTKRQYIPALLLCLIHVGIYRVVLSSLERFAALV